MDGFGALESIPSMTRVMPTHTVEVAIQHSTDIFNRQQCTGELLQGLKKSSCQLFSLQKWNEIFWHLNQLNVRKYLPTNHLDVASVPGSLALSYSPPSTSSLPLLSVYRKLQFQRACSSYNHKKHNAFSVLERNWAHKMHTHTHKGREAEWNVLLLLRSWVFFLSFHISIWLSQENPPHQGKSIPDRQQTGKETQKTTISILRLRRPLRVWRASELNAFSVLFIRSHMADVTIFKTQGVSQGSSLSTPWGVQFAHPSIWLNLN